MQAPSLTLRRTRAVSAALALLLGTCAWAQVSVDKPFTDTMLSTEQSAAGLGKLSRGQQDELNRQITKELTLARQGDVKGFAVPFTQRRTEAQRKAAGLDSLSVDELKTLDGVIARTMAIPTKPGTFARATSIDSIETVRIRPEIHGEVSLTYGMGSGGRSFYGGSMAMTYEDPASGITTSLVYSQYRGDAWLMSGRNGFGGACRPGSGLWRD